MSSVSVSQAAAFPPVHILGGGAVGLALAVCLAAAGRDVTLIRTQRAAGEATPGVPQEIPVTMTDGEKPVLGAAVRQVPLEAVAELGGILVVAVKSHANAALAEALSKRRMLPDSTLVVMQNGLGVEAAFRSLPCQVMRAVLYMTGERCSETEVLFRAITSSPVGPVAEGMTEETVARCVAALSTPVFPFHVECASGIARHAWGKTVINAVFNSVCPLLEADNGLFARDAAAEALAAEIVREGIALAAREGVVLDEAALRERILAISRGSDGVLISTLQDLRQGRPTEMAALNLELARRAAAQVPPVPLPNIALLGRLVEMKGRRP